jgi:cobalt-zinc-cadmium efflux system outer membrane protein
MRPFLLAVAQLLVAGGFLISHAGAKEPAGNKLSLTGATREALSHNPSITSTWRKWRGMRARIKQETAWEDPRISYDTTAARFVEMAPNSMADQTLALEQMIPLSGKNVSRGRVAAAEALGAFEEFRRQQLNVSSKVRSAYFQLLNARRQLALNAQNTTSVQQIATALRAKYEAGTQLVPDVLAAEIESAKLDEQRRDLERIQSEARTKLNVLMNRPPASPIGEVSDPGRPPPRLSERELMSLLLSSRPEVRIARSRIEAEKARLQLAKREWIPDPAVNVNAQRYNDASQTVSQLGTGISVSIPWANPGKYSEAVREADENLQAATADLQSVKSESLGLLHDQLLRIETARHHYELYSGSIREQAQQAFEASQLGYETGKSTFSDWITAHRSLRDVRTVASEMFTDYQTALAELEAIVGAPLSGTTTAERPAPHSHSKK